jgi:hypothetical protein
MPKCEKCHQELPVAGAEGFGWFKDIYPRKCAWKDAERVWCKLPLKDRIAALEDLGWIVFGREKGKLSVGGSQPGRYDGAEKQFIPYPATYLRGKRWTDELPTQTIPDPPKPAPNDGGLARRTFSLSEDGKKVEVVPREEALRRFGDILGSMKVKSL